MDLSAIAVTVPARTAAGCRGASRPRWTTPRYRPQWTRPRCRPRLAATDESTLDLLVRLSAERAELPIAAVAPDSLPLDELHISSITVGQIMNEAARVRGLPPPAVTSSFATSTLRQLAKTLDELSDTGLPADAQRDTVVAGVAGWVRSFSVEWVAAPALATVAALASSARAGEWRTFDPAGHPLAEPVARALSAAGLGGGVLLCLPADCERDQVAGDARGGQGRAGHRRTDPVRGAPATVEARRAWPRRCTWEAPRVATCISTCPPPARRPGGSSRRFVRRGRRVRGVHRGAVRRGRRAVGTGAARGTGAGVPARHDPARQRGRAHWSPAAARASTAECAPRGRPGHRGPRRPARPLGPGPATRSWPTTCSGWTAAGVRYRYVRGDVTSAEDMRAAVATVEAELGTVTARTCTAPGSNEPTALSNLDESRVRPHAGPEDRRPARGTGRGRPGKGAAAGHVRQHHRPGRPARRGGLRAGQRLDDRADPGSRPGLPALAGRWPWSGRYGPARAWASG